MIWIGTSGFQYKEWCGSFYPEKMSEAKMLPFYATQFSTVEINYTFKRVPPESAITKWMQQTPEQFKFTLKVHQRITHSHAFTEAELLRFFITRAKLLGPKLGVLLFQFPPTLKKDFHFLTALIEELPEGLRAAFEFRHKSWFEDGLYERLRARNLALCIAEDENRSTPIVNTADYGYFRLRIEKYSAEDIARWAKEIKAVANWKDAFVYFKHEDEGTGPTYVRQLMEHFGQKQAPTSLFE